MHHKIIMETWRRFVESASRPDQDDPFTHLLEDWEQGLATEEEVYEHLNSYISEELGNPSAWDVLIEEEEGETPQIVDQAIDKLGNSVNKLSALAAKVGSDPNPQSVENYLNLVKNFSINAAKMTHQALQKGQGDKVGEHFDRQQSQLLEKSIVDKTLDAVFRRLPSDPSDAMSVILFGVVTPVLMTAIMASAPGMAERHNKRVDKRIFDSYEQWYEKEGPASPNELFPHMAKVKPAQVKDPLIKKAVEVFQDTAAAVDAVAKSPDQQSVAQAQKAGEEAIKHLKDLAQKGLGPAKELAAKTKNFKSLESLGFKPTGI